MRECWINVYVARNGRQFCGQASSSRSFSAHVGECVSAGGALRVGYRLHVRLKPEAQIRIEHGIFI